MGVAEVVLIISIGLLLFGMVAPVVVEAIFSSKDR